MLNLLLKTGLVTLAGYGLVKLAQDDTVQKRAREFRDKAKNTCVDNVPSKEAEEADNTDNQKDEQLKETPPVGKAC